MTTEVLRNMIYANSDALMSLGYVIMDEVHYLADRFRGAVWEEVILHLPKDVRVVSLSATVSNAEEFGAWLDEVRGSTEIIVSEVRPVPLTQHVLFGNEMLDLFDATPGAPRVNPELSQMHANKLRQPLNKPAKGRGGGGNNWQKHQANSFNRAKTKYRIYPYVPIPHLVEPRLPLRCLVTLSVENQVH
jgi:ATP-dependent RNA helicase HelY